MKNKNFRFYLGLFLLFYPVNFYLILIIFSSFVRDCERLVYIFIYRGFDPGGIYVGRVYQLFYNFTSVLAVCWGIYLLSKKNLNVKRFAAQMISGAASLYIIILYSVRLLENENLLFQGYIFTVSAMSVFAAAMFILSLKQVFGGYFKKTEIKRFRFKHTDGLK